MQFVVKISFLAVQYEASSTVSSMNIIEIVCVCVCVRVRVCVARALRACVCVCLCDQLNS